MRLNERQAEVAAARDGRVVVVAGPGSGKTATLVARVRELLAAGAPPATIAACTFTIRAADELETRLGTTLGYCGTIHGLARTILAHHGDHTRLGGLFSVLDEADVDDLYRNCHRELRLRSSLRALRGRIQALAHAGGDPEAMPAADSPEGIEAARLETAFREVCARLRSIDFDGLIREARLLLLRHPEVARRLHERLHHLSVDEAQDLDAAQDHLLDLVAPPENAIPGTARSTLYVGDPLQSIYGWRGGDPALFLRRGERAHTRVMLGQNYRSTKGVVAHANAVSADDPLRPADYMLLPTRAGTDRDVWLCAPFADDAAEISAVVGMVQRARLAGVAFREMAVLGRTNGMLANVAERMREGGVPFQHLGTRKARLEQDVIRGALAYLRVFVNPADDLAVLRALRCPARPAMLADAKFPDRMRAAAEGGALFAAARACHRWAQPGEWEPLESFVGLVEDIGGAPNWAEGTRGLFGFLVAAHQALGMQTRADEILWLRTLLDGFLDDRLPGARRARKTPEGFLWWLAHGQGAGEHDPEADLVTLSTIHLAKGLEWRVVFVPGLVERVFPSAPACNAEAAGVDDAIAEERRCFFVAATRARDQVVLTRCAALRDRGGLALPAQESRFVGYARAVVTVGGGE